MIIIQRVLKLPDEVQTVIDQQKQKEQQGIIKTSTETLGSIKIPVPTDTLQND